MRVPHSDLLLFLSAAAILASAASRVRSAVAGPPPDPRSTSTQYDASRTPPTLDDARARLTDDSTDYTGLIVDNDLFRLANAPSTVRYSPATEGMGAPQVAVARPALSVKAIVGGPPWQAMIDGLPGASPTLVRSGQLVGPLTVTAVGRDTVTVRGMDTTWKLTLHGSRP